MAKIANPQGKGNHLLNNHWYPPIPAEQKSHLREKSPREIMNDLMLSSLVLSAEFSFKPVPGMDYYLYLWKGVLRLSLIPSDKCQIEQVEAMAICQLKTDLTWQVTLYSELCADVIEFLKRFGHRFAAHLDQEKPLADLLPVYEASLPFYRRLYASGLAKSLRISMASQNMLTLQSKKVVENLKGNDLLPGSSR